MSWQKTEAIWIHAYKALSGIDRIDPLLELLVLLDHGQHTGICVGSDGEAAVDPGLHILPGFGLIEGEPVVDVDRRVDLYLNLVQPGICRFCRR